MLPSITFETKCYENDWKFLLKKGFLEKMIDNCNHAFNHKVLFINNCKNYPYVEREASKLIQKNILDKYYIVEEHANTVLEYFEIDKSTFEGGYYYSIAELTAIYFCNTEFLLHFSSDSMIEQKSTTWIDSAIALMNTDPSILVANPVWNHKFDEAKNEAFNENDDWFYSFGFSDQCYLIKTARFKNQIYNHSNLESERYPAYGGNLFEKRVDAYMRNNNLTRITNKHISYVHENFPKDWRKFLKYYFG